MDERSGMCKAMREIQEDFAEKDRLISRYQQENSWYQQENSRYQQELLDRDHAILERDHAIARLQGLLKEHGVEF